MCLILLATMRCSIDLTQLDLAHLSWFPDKSGCIFYLPCPTKTYTQKTSLKSAKLLQNVELKELPFDKFSPQSDLKMCRVHCLSEYIRRTETLRIGHSKLFIITTEPFSPCKKPTICTWVKTVMSQAGIDLGNYASHSFRLASSSKAFWVGININTIMKKAGWSSKNVFINHYLKKVKGHTLTVLNQEESGVPWMPPLHRQHDVEMGEKIRQEQINAQKIRKFAQFWRDTPIPEDTVPLCSRKKPKQFETINFEHLELDKFEVGHMTVKCDLDPVDPDLDQYWSTPLPDQGSLDRLCPTLD